ncbi:MAG: ABC transporter substrate-binding protein [Myxococcota bacterium]|nr:ABC transporter substrate-binding protein [Myxococcota bacterium]
MNNKTLHLFALGIALSLAGPASGTALRYAEDQAPGIINPLFTTSMSEARVNELLFDGLFTDDRDLASTPALVDNWELAEDKLSMTLSLKPDLYWQDGTPLSTKDVVFTIEAMKNPKTLSSEAGRVEWIKSAEALSSQQLRLTFNQPEFQPQDKLFFKIVPSHAFDSTTVRRGDDFRTKPVGTGPYQFISYNPDNSITYRRNTDYRDSVGIPELVMREVNDKNYQAKLMLFESMEALIRVLPRDLAVLQNNRLVELYPYQTNSWWYTGFNLTRAPFNEPKVRAALAHMVDVEALLAPVGTGAVLSGPFVKSSPYYNHDVAPVSADPFLAGGYLEEAGFEQGPDGWQRDGEVLTLQLSAPKAVEDAQEIVLNLQAQLQQNGVSVTVEFLDEAEWKARIWRNRDFDMLLSQWSFDRNEDVRDQFHSKGARNFGSYTNEKVDDLLDRARNSSDPYEKKMLLREAHRVIHEDHPMIFLWTLDSYAALNTKISQVAIHPFYFFTYVSSWRMK